MTGTCRAYAEPRFKVKHHMPGLSKPVYRDILSLAARSMIKNKNCGDLMKDRISFLVISSGTGKQRRFSINRKLLYSVFLLCLMLLVTGVLGALKYRENIQLNRKYLQLEAEKAQVAAASRSVEKIQKEASAVRSLLGLESVSLNGSDD